MKIQCQKPIHLIRLTLTKALISLHHFDNDKLLEWMCMNKIWTGACASAEIEFNEIKVQQKWQVISVKTGRERETDNIMATILKKNTTNDVVMNANKSSRHDISHPMKFIQINLNEEDNSNKIKDLNYFYYFYHFESSQMSNYYGRRSLSSNATAMDGRSYVGYALCWTYAACNTTSYVVAREWVFWKL